MKRRNKISSFRKDERGNVMIIAAFGLVAFLAIASLVVDLGLRYYQKSCLQNALDSAALAAAPCLPDKARAKETALEYVEKNGFDAGSVIIEFPEDDVIRVSDTVTSRTLFATVFSEDSMVINGRAAAKYVNKKMSIDFDYLMFYGEDSTFYLNGDFREVAGSVFGNGNIRVGCNDAAVIYDIVSARDITFENNMGTPPNVKNHSANQKMPDWDEMIMSVCPTCEKERFTAPVPHITREKNYKYRLNGDTYLNNFIAYADGGIFCSGKLGTNYTTAILYVRGDLYVEGDFAPQCPIYVTGNVYVGGNFTPVWNMSITVGGDMYVAGNAEFQGTTDIGGKMYCGKNMSIINGNGTSYKFKEIRCMGSFTSMAAWNARINVNGNMYIYDKLTLGGGHNNITGNIYVWGHNSLVSEDVCYLNGDLLLKGDVWCHKGIVAFGGNGNCEIHGIVYSGDSIETRTGGDISLNGCMIAEGNIRIGGASHTYNDSGATLSLYSRKGNIELGSQGTELKMWGIVYAPKGDIKISTDGLRIYGSLVGNTLTCNIGCGFYIGRNDRTLPFAKTVRAAALVE